MKSPLIILSLLSGLCMVAAASPVIDDRGLRAKFQKELAGVAERENHLTGKDLAAQAAEARKRESIELPPRPDTDGKMNYNDEVKGTVIVGAAYKCGKCDKWHMGGAATGWVLSANGLMVTNNHVFEDADKEAYGIMTLDGKFAEITKIEIADAAADIAVFQVDGRGFTPLPLATDIQVGDPVHVISHPDSRLFTYTAGRVSRFYKRPGKDRTSTWMAITADYARGSSGGPVFNDRGEVVGMVSSTSSIYYGKKPGESSDKTKQRDALQMVIKNCVSLQELRRLLVDRKAPASSQK